MLADYQNDGLFYTSQDLEYIYFVHSLCLLGRVLLYSGGRAFFPVLLPDTEGNFYQYPTVIYDTIKIAIVIFDNLFYVQLVYIVHTCLMVSSDQMTSKTSSNFQHYHRTYHYLLPLIFKLKKIEVTATKN